MLIDCFRAGLPALFVGGVGETCAPRGIPKFNFGRVTAIK